MTVHRLAGILSVEASAQRIRRYRYLEERVMRMLGGWIALTPELTAKLLLGRHVWDCAQHADLWGKRLLELRSTAQESESPGPEFARLVDEVEHADAVHQTPERLAGVYGVLKPCLLAAYERHLVESNPVYEPPTRRILQRCIDEERRHVAAGLTVLRHLSRAAEIASRVDGQTAVLRSLLEQTSGIAGDGAVTLASATPGEAEAIAEDLVELERPVGPWPMPPPLVEALAEQARAILAGDRGALEARFLPDVGPDARSAYPEVDASGGGEITVVACARIGAYWVVKQRATTAEGVVVVQSRWREVGGRWGLADAEVVRREPVG